MMWVDFNSRDGRGLIRARSSEVDAGDRIQLRDADEELQGWGTVVEYRNGLAFVDVEWDTIEATA